MTNSSQGGTASLTLSAFGQTVASTGSSSIPYQFGATSGYRTEGDAGLTLVGCRFYDAQVGRFITRDTDLSQKAYVYCEVDPVNGLDPSGHNVIFSAGFGGSFSFFTQRFTYSFGAAFDLNNGDFELTSTPGHYHGVGLGADAGPYLGLGSGTLSGFNGASSGYNASLGAGAVGGVAYDYNSGYKGVTISAGIGLEGGAFMGIPGSGSSTRGGSYTFNPGGIHNFNN